jgi:hypothetical protein
MAIVKKPPHEIWRGAIRAAIYTNEASDGSRWYSLVVTRRYKDKQGLWQDTHSFKVQHLSVLAQVINEAHRWMQENSMTPEAKSLIDQLDLATASSRPQSARRAP